MKLNRKILLTACAALLVGVAAALAAGGAVTHASLPLASLSASVRIVRDLSAAEAAAPLRFTVSLPMRNMDRFAATLGSGGRISPAEMETNYLPPNADYLALLDWASAHGFIVTQDDPNHTVAFLQGSVSHIASVFSVVFARVQTADGEFSSAVSENVSLPADLPVTPLSVGGLQAHRCLHPALVEAPDGNFLVTPSEVMAAYNWPGPFGTDTVATNAAQGQVVAIFLDETQVPNASDFDAYCHLLSLDVAGISWANTVTLVSVNGGTLTQGTGSNLGAEGNLDLCQVAGFAPGCQIRIYVTPTSDYSDMQAVGTRILSDIKAGINVTALTISYAGDEAVGDSSYSQSFGQLAAAGVTVCAGSGDGGSNPNSATIPPSYSANSPLAVAYPASDPYVTGVGATWSNGNTNGLPQYVGFFPPFDEVVWGPGLPLAAGAGSQLASGGGYSLLFPQPTWQTDGGTILTADAAKNARCIPDIAVLDSYGITVVNGQYFGTEGTSASSPIFAAMVACVNAARGAAGKPPIGLLGPAIYANAACFNKITSGTNGAYSAQADGSYNLCTGLGSPDWAKLYAALVAYPQLIQAPSITEQPTGATIAAGQSFSLSVAASGTAPSYQWYVNGGAIASATSATLLVSNASTADAGIYTCVATNPLGSATSSPATLAVVSTSDIGHLINISCRATVGTGGSILIAGFVVEGEGSSSTEPLLIRGSGPALNQFGVTGVLPDPQLQLYHANAGGTSTLLETNDGWAGNAHIASAAASVGAFAWSNPNSHDSASLSSLQPGGYTAQIAGQNGDTGVALVEVYDATAPGAFTPTSPRLINLSARVRVGTGGNILIAGFVIGGSTAETVLIRASGPALTQFGLTGVLPDPQLQLYRANADGTSTLLQTNDGWAGNAQLASAGVSVGAFAWTSASSHDSALLATLPPGGYTAQIAGQSGDTGLALIEVYEIP